MTTLSLGKIRGLTSTSTTEDIFTVLAFDHRQSFVQMLSESPENTTMYSLAAGMKSEIVRAVGENTSAVLLDPIYGVGPAIAQQALPGSTGLLVAVEASGYTGSATARESQLLGDWSVGKIKRLGADAVKLLVYYHPGAGLLAARQEELIADVVAQCGYWDLPLFLEAISYSIDPAVDKGSARFAESRPSLLAEIAWRLGRLGPEVLKLEFPVDVAHCDNKQEWAAGCAAVSEAAGCPWVLLSAGVDFEIFAEQVEVACQHGASGYIAGRAIWREATSLPAKARGEWLKDVAARRLATLTAIARRYGRPWTDFWPNLDLAAYQGWHADYQAPEATGKREL